MLFMTISGIAIVIGTIYCLVKRYETRLVLFCSGLLMTLIGGAPMDTMKAFSHAMLETKLFAFYQAIRSRK